MIPHYANYEWLIGMGAILSLIHIQMCIRDRYDYMLEHTNPEYVFFQMDLYWVVRGQNSPVDYFNKDVYKRQTQFRKSLQVFIN